MKILSVISTRPELIKMAPLMKEMLKRKIEHVFITTGQHYDYQLFQGFVQALGLPRPDEDLEVGSGSQAFQTSISLLKLEEVIKRHNPDAVIAEGDTNSVLSAALAAQKLLIPFIHVEAGLRSFDRTMPEEVNRIIADHCSELLAAPTQTSKKNLLLERVPEEKIVVTGNPIVDIFFEHIKKADSSTVLNDIKFKEFCLLTLHRKENVDDVEKLKIMISILGKIKRNFVFPIHPRTKTIAIQNNLLAKITSLKNVQLIEPQQYFDFLKLEKKCQCILTDSGGITEEALMLGKPCLVLRNNTERPEVLSNICRLTGINEERILASIEKVMSAKPQKYGDQIGSPGVSKRTVDAIVMAHEAGNLKVKPSNFFEHKYY